MVRACHAQRQPLQNHPSRQLGRLTTPRSAEEMLDGQHQSVDIPHSSPNEMGGSRSPLYYYYYYYYYYSRRASNTPRGFSLGYRLTVFWREEMQCWLLLHFLSGTMPFLGPSNLTLQSSLARKLQPFSQLGRRRSSKMPWCEWLWLPPSLPAQRGRALGDRLVVKPRNISQLLPHSLHYFSLRLCLVPPLSVRRRRVLCIVKARPLPIGSTPNDFAPIPYPTPHW